MTEVSSSSLQLTESQKKMQNQLRILRQQSQLLTIQLADVKNHEQQLKKLTKTLIDNFGDRVNRDDASLMNQVLKDIKIIIDGDSSWEKQKIRELEDKLEKLIKEKDDQVEARVRKMYEQMVNKFNSSFNKSFQHRGVSSSTNQISVKSSKELENQRANLNFPLVSFSASSQLHICLKCLQLDQKNHNLRKIQIKLNGELQGLKKRIHQYKKHQRQMNVANLSKQQIQNDKEKNKLELKSLKAKLQNLEGQNHRLKEIVFQYQGRNRELIQQCSQLQEQFIESQKRWKEEFLVLQEEYQRQIQRLSRHSYLKEREELQSNIHNHSQSMKREIQTLVKEIGEKSKRQQRQIKGPLGPLLQMQSYKQNNHDSNSNSKISYEKSSNNISKTRKSLLGNTRQRTQFVKSQYCDFTIKDAINRPNRGLTFY